MNANDFTERLAKLSPAKRTLLELRLQQKAAADSGAQTIPRSTTRDTAPLSFAQQRLWFLNQLEPASPIYNESRAIRLRGSLDVEALRKSLNRIVARHDVLRTNFLTLDGSPQQTIADSRIVELPVIDLRSCRDADRESEAHRLLTDAIRRPFDLSRDLLLRVLLLRLAEQEHILLFVKHHIASDGWSTSIFWRELTALYEAFISGRPDPLPELPIQYADYALWQRDRLRGEVLESQLAYWRKQLENLATLQLTADRPRPTAHNYAGDRQTFLIPLKVVDGLRRLSRDEGVTLFMVLLAAFQTLLHRYTGQNDIAVGSPIAGRTHPEVEDLIGFFVNTLVLRTEVSGYLTFRQLLARVREVAWGAYQHQDLPFEKLVAELQPDRNLGRNPLFEVVFAFQNVPRQNVALPGLAVSHVEADSGTTKFDLALFMWEEHEGLRGRIQYSTALFDADTIERLLGHFETMLVGIVTDPDQRLSDLPLLTEREKHQSLVEWNNTATAYPKDACIHELFEEQVEKSPEAIAVVFEEEQLSYRELNERANQLANYLRKAGVGRETLVGICIERSTALIVGLLGILKAGGTYVPLDPVYPKERLAFMLEDTRTPVLLTQERFIEDKGLKIEDSDSRSLRLRLGQAASIDPRLKVICLDRDWETIARESMDNPSNGGTAEDLAYVMYTSGSTGQPKGVEIPHRGVSRLLFGGTYARLDAEQALLQLAPISFDASTFEIWGALLRGGKCVLYPGRVPSAGEASDLIHKHKVTTLWLTASLFNALIDEAPGTLSEIKQLLIGGEVLSVSHVRRGLALLPYTEIINGYGPTESTTFACSYSIPKHLEETAGPIPIGRPIGNTQVYVLDRDLNPSPVGVPGEIYIGGDGLARGYLNQPELTAERFIPNPFAERPGARLYRTGDLARYSRDGNIEFIGRMDNQVKIRGYRIELGEIESVLVQHPAVGDAVVLVREELVGDPSVEFTLSADEGLRMGKRLVAYVVQSQGPAVTVSELRSFLKHKLPEYMIPSTFVFLESLPLTPNGKVDRKALPVPDQGRPELEVIFVRPRNPVEELIAEIWAEVLRVERIGIHDNFFDLGGHSLLATQVVSRVRGALQLEISLRALFETPTVAGLAERVDEIHQTEQGLQTLPLLPVSRDKDLPLSFAQQRLWFLDHLEPGSTVYNVPGAVHMRGFLDVTALEQSLNEIVRRHEALRTTFSTIDGEAVQIISSSLSVSLQVVDLSEQAESEREEEARRLAREEARRHFDLARGPLVRVTLLRLGHQDHVLLLTLHHIVSDGWSMGVLYRELSVLYEAFSNGQPSPLSDLAIQYADFAIWQREWLQGKALESQLSYWKKQLEGVPAVINLPTDRSRPAVQSFRGARQSIELSKELTQRVKALSRKQDVTLFMTLLAAFQTLLHRYTGQDDIAVGSPIANRNRTEIESLIGFFVNTLVLRTNFSGNPTFRELLARVRDVALAAYAHQDLPFERLVEELHPERSLSYSPLFQVMFALQNAPSTVWEFEGLTLRSFGVDSETAKFDLTLSMHEGADGLRGSLQYNTDLFEPVTIERMLIHFQVLLEGIVTDPDQRLSDLPIVSASERHQLLVEWNDTRRDYPKEKCIHQLFEEQVEKSPDAVAVVFEDRQLSYRELNQRANQLAHYLRKLGVGPDSLVGICMERSLEMVVGLLGILKAGGAYVPLDPDYPNERLAFMVGDTQPRALLTQEKLIENVPAGHARAVCLDREWEEIARESKENPANEATAENLAYVIYTSGSTGKPNGVAIVHRSTVAFLSWAHTIFTAEEMAAVLGSTSVCFDLSVFELFAPLSCGGQVVLMQNALALPGLASVSHVTLINTVPSAIAELLRMNAIPASVCTISLAGEPLKSSLVREIYQGTSASKVYDLYGPSEDTTYSTCALRTLTGPQTIGKPISNTCVYLLNQQMQPVPIGVHGDLYIGGDGLARGYLNRAELTAERFVSNPFSKEPGARLYKTGDLARYLPDGNIEFLGRIDHQVKIRGFRVELGEIEALLGQHPAVRECVAIVREDVPGDRRLVAYVVANQEPTPGTRELRSFLKQKLPEYLVPSDFMLLDAIPLTPNGKVDRGSLPVLPDRSGYEYGKVFVAPRDKAELWLTKVWEKILNVRSVGVQDSFFDLGGHSLLAVRLLALVEKEFGRSVPLAALFEGPTVEKLADLLRLGGDALKWNWLVPLQPVGSKPPVFLLHASRELAQQIGTDHPIYGLRPHGLDGRRAPLRAEEMAADYISEIRMVQPEGPYVIGGYSFGGLVAFEVAQQLREQGQEVRLLVMLDPTSPGYGRVRSDSSSFSGGGNRRFGEKVDNHLKTLGSLTVKKMVAYMREGVKWRFDEIKSKVKMLGCRAFLSVGQRVPLGLRRLYFMEAGRLPARNYMPEVYHGRVVLLRTRKATGSPSFDWSRLVTEELEIYEMPGRHLEAMQGLHLEAWAEQLRASLQSV